MAKFIDTMGNEVEIKMLNRQLSHLLIGDTFEIVQLSNGNSMLANESGLAMSLPVNYKATILYAESNIIQHPPQRIMGNVIVGTNEEIHLGIGDKLYKTSNN